MKVGIAGAGIMGQLLAFSLINLGWKVTLFDPAPQNNCSMAAAGLLCPVAELDKCDEIIFQLGRASIEQHWPSLLSHFDETIYFRQSGSLVIAHPRDRTDLDRFATVISKKLPDQRYYTAVDQEQIQQLEPEITGFERGLFLSEEGQIDNQAFMQTLTQYLDKREITWVDHDRVTVIQPGEIDTRDKKYYFDCVFDCRGLGAKAVFPALRGVRGELIWLFAPDVAISRPIRLLHPRYAIYIVPRPQHRYLIGTSEMESEDVSPINVRTVLELLTAAYSVQAKFADAHIIKTVAHCRPTLPNHAPKIRYAEGYIAVNGLYRHGFLVAPALVADILRWLAQGISAVQYPQLFEQEERVNDNNSVSR